MQTDLNLPEFIATFCAPTTAYNKTCGTYFLKHRWEEYCGQYAGTNEQFITTLKNLGYKINKNEQLKLRYIG